MRLSQEPLDIFLEGKGGYDIIQRRMRHYHLAGRGAGKESSQGSSYGMLYEELIPPDHLLCRQKP